VFTHPPAPPPAISNDPPLSRTKQVSYIEQLQSTIFYFIVVHIE
jgi:hypothetical protein